MITLSKHQTRTRFACAACIAIALFAVQASPSMAADLGTEDGEYQNPANEKSWYVSVFGGSSFIKDDVNFSNGATTVSTDFDNGFNIGATIGHRWHSVPLGGFVPRTEIEVRYDEHDVDAVDFSGNGVGNELLASGSEMTSLSILTNLYFDAPDAFELFGRRFTPYFGGGVGINFVEHDISYNTPGFTLRDRDEAFTWHATVGYSFDVWDSVSTFTQVGYHQSIGTGSKRRVGGIPVAGAGGGSFEDDVSSIVIKSGLRVNF